MSTRKYPIRCEKLERERERERENLKNKFNLKNDPWINLLLL